MPQKLTRCSLSLWVTKSYLYKLIWFCTTGAPVPSIPAWILCLLNYLLFAFEVEQKWSGIFQLSNSLNVSKLFDDVPSSLSSSATDSSLSIFSHSSIICLAFANLISGLLLNSSVVTSWLFCFPIACCLTSSSLKYASSSSILWKSSMSFYRWLISRLCTVNVSSISSWMTVWWDDVMTTSPFLLMQTLVPSNTYG